MSARAGIVVTGTEVLTGRVRDRNGPWLSDRLLELGVELAHITICGDRRADMEAQLRFMVDQGVDLIVTSGGLGPTADDLTLEVVAGFMGRPLELDDALEERIADILRPLMKRWPHLDFEAIRASNRKQALVPEGAEVIEPAGTAPGMVVPPRNGDRPTVVVMPGPPRELHSMWPQATRTETFRRAVGGRTEYTQRTLRLFGIPESEIAETLRVAEPSVRGFEQLEITTCLRRGEVEVVVRHESASEPAFDELLAMIAERHEHTLFSTDGSSVDDQVAELLHGRRVALAESCTAGLMAARLTERPGSSGYVAGGVVAYSNEAKTDLLDVDPGLIERHGAVSPGGRGGDGRRCASPPRRRHVGRHHGHRGTRRRQRGEAGGLRMLVLQARRRLQARPRHPAAGRPQRHPRSLHDRRHAPPAPPAARRGAPLRRVSRERPKRPRTRLFLALELPDEARRSLAAWRDGALGGLEDLRLVRAEYLHVTLVFLGWQYEREVDRIAATAFEPLAGLPAPELAASGLRPDSQARPTAVRTRSRRSLRSRLEGAGGRCRRRSPRHGSTSRRNAPSGRT